MLRTSHQREDRPGLALGRRLCPMLLVRVAAVYSHGAGSTATTAVTPLDVLAFLVNNSDYRTRFAFVAAQRAGGEGRPRAWLERLVSNTQPNQ